MLGKTTAQAPTTVGRRYVIYNRLGQGGMGGVYRALDRLTGQEVALKRVTAPAEQLSFASKTKTSDFRLALAHEFQTLASLRHPNIISVLDYGFEYGADASARQPYFTMDLLHNAQTILNAARFLPLLGKVNMLVQTLQALAYLHRRGILHRDLKPGNVMVIGGQVRVLDFGLSVERQHSHQDEDQVVGTLPYMAPEVLQGKDASEAADLYAIGVMAYELFAGRHPFNLSDITGFITETVNKPPDVASLDVSPEIAMLLSQLLAKVPAERPASANDVIVALSKASGQAVPAETVAIRESFLQAARLAGREAEMEQFGKVLDDTIGGKGGAWLVGGESGVGKSRLLDELRTLALVKGAVVLRSQSVSEGGGLYQVWRNTLHWLCLLTDLNDHEASVLKALVPDIAGILGREVADAPELDPQGTQQRLFGVVADVFRRQGQPVVVILEDMHWASSESLALFNVITPLTGTLPVLLIANYRDDERPTLPNELPGVQVFKLSRLSEEGIAQLSESMLGTAGTQPQVVNLLQRETEGNVFFLVEVVRALAEDAGQLDLVGRKTLPEKIFAGGIQNVVERRLQRVPAEAYALLQVAAVAGRQLDLDVLRSVVAKGALPLPADFSLEVWLTACSDAAVLDVQDDRWRFVHDKLREGIVGKLSDEQGRAQHRQVAEAIEQVYATTLEAQAAPLTYHWGAAGEVVKEMQYASMAGTQALRSNANAEAIHYFSRALDILKTFPPSPELIGQELQLQLALATPMVATLGYTSPKVQETFLRARELCEMIGEVPQLGQALFGLGGFYMVRAEHTTSMGFEEQILRMGEKTGDPMLLMLGHWGVGLLQMYMGQLESARQHFEQVLAIYDPAKFGAIAIIFQDPQVTIYSWMTWALWLMGYFDQAAKSAEQAVRWSRESNHLFSRGFGLGLTAGYHQMRRDQPAMDAIIDETLALGQEHNLVAILMTGLFLKGWLLAQAGIAEQGAGLMTQGLQVAAMIGQNVLVPHYMALQAQALGKLGQLEEALTTLDKAFERVEQSSECYFEPEMHRIRGDLLAQKGAPAAWIEQHYQKAIEVAQKHGSRALELRATVSLARLWQDKRRDEAHAMLNTIYAWFTEGHDCADLQDARVLLDALQA